MSMSMYICMCKPEVSVGCLPQSLPTLFFETRSLAELGARWLVCPGWSAASGIFLSVSVLEFEDHNSTDFYGGSGNLCFHGSSLLTELFPSPFVVFPKLITAV